MQLTYLLAQQYYINYIYGNWIYIFNSLLHVLIKTLGHKSNLMFSYVKRQILTKMTICRYRSPRGSQAFPSDSTKKNNP